MLSSFHPTQSLTTALIDLMGPGALNHTAHGIIEAVRAIEVRLPIVFFFIWCGRRAQGIVADMHAVREHLLLDRDEWEWKRNAVAELNAAQTQPTVTLDVGGRWSVCGAPSGFVFFCCHWLRRAF